MQSLFSQVMHQLLELRLKPKRINYIILSFYNIQLSYITRTRIFFAIVEQVLNLGCVYCNSSTYFTNTCVILFARACVCVYVCERERE